MVKVVPTSAVLQKVVKAHSILFQYILAYICMGTEEL